MKREGMLFKRIMGGVLSLTMTLSMVTSTMGTAFAAEKSEEDGYQIYPQVHYADYSWMASMWSWRMTWILIRCPRRKPYWRSTA